MDNYGQLLERISGAAGLKREELERKIEAKRAKLSGLISKEGAAQIVAAELGIVLDGERLKIKELVQGMRKSNVVGKVIRIFPVREFNKNGREGKVASFVLADDTGNTRVALWDTHHIELIEKQEIKEGDVVEVINGSVRQNGELHLSGFSDLKKSDEKVEDIVEERSYTEAKIKDLKEGLNARVRAIIVQMFEPRYFEDKNSGEKKAVLTVVLDDGSESIRGVLFGDDIKKLGFEDEEIFSLEKFEGKKGDVIGEEKYFAGNVRMNSFFGRIEMVMNGVEEVNPGELIKELEAKV
ncbi:hypothetical protein COU62_04375 [Candidatus Pacearchaeota archaeon CG10_big_fil_rev_8_21_14_0_10_35_219]|nr:hypothetical protein [Candidatus Pacearchaeota archaeon]OIO42097.1 MAG: hypothetical protein AUJ63_04095 [Candidatus Pacearchaeota archaeon CG1_02_35_32]PIO07229.1 MAG: hypothetical protein COU62_04375 [Candidatus Pacearchaeota archaeon CG10_big_fil_rev_8_21_14_0_10_35_219]PIY81202.1 MAG: hypothetical protein COY79_04135 [Candidatus Pacearchaeota archaeon CG_4_10_14_0_8_um_filter_35_169]PIZ79453.1 MAG: hypothetical protein COY00_04145 [Candidatus Pacearchaeota archaeon CG_4_10_14_0_2_um_filt